MSLVIFKNKHINAHQFLLSFQIEKAWCINSLILLREMKKGYHVTL